MEKWKQNEAKWRKNGEKTKRDQHNKSEVRFYLLLGWESRHSVLATQLRFSGVARTETRSTSHHTQPEQNTTCAKVSGGADKGWLQSNLEELTAAAADQKVSCGLPAEWHRSHSLAFVPVLLKPLEIVALPTQSSLHNSSVRINGVTRTCTPATEGRGRSPPAALTMNVLTRPSSRVCRAVSDSKSRSPSLAFGSFSFLQKPYNNVNPFFVHLKTFTRFVYAPVLVF